MASRRSPGEGSVYREGNGWRAALTILDPVTGRVKTIRRRARTKSEAVALLQQMRIEAANGQLSQANTTVSQAVAAWLEVVASRPVRGNPGPSEKTMAMHRHRGAMIERALGTRRLPELTVADVDRFLRDAADGKFGARSNSRDSLRRIRATLINVLDNAKRRGQVGRNVATDSELPASASNSKEKTALDPEQRDRLYATLADSAMGVLVLLCGYYGLRPAEARALTWRDISTSQLSINKQLDNSDTATAPKTKRASRIIGIEPATTAALDRWKAIQQEQRTAVGEAWQDLDLLITSEVGTPLDKGNIRRYLHRACDELGLPRISSYELRHTAITIMSTDDDISLVQLADYAGTSTQMIEGTYRHPNSDRVLTVKRKIPVPETPT